MKFYCGLSKEDKENRKFQKQANEAYEFHRFYRDWVRVFAWLPVRLNDGRCAWLETVEMKFKHPYSEKDCYSFLYEFNWSISYVNIKFQYRAIK